MQRRDRRNDWIDAVSPAVQAHSLSVMADEAYTCGDVSILSRFFTCIDLN